MLRRYSFWLTTALVVQILTALIHSLSFFRKPAPSNETEEQLFNLLNTYERDLGAGFHPTSADLFIALSACFTLVYLLGGLINWYLLRKKADPSILKGITGIQILIFGAGFILMYVYTFLPPIVLTGLVFAFLLPAYFLNKGES